MAPFYVLFHSVSHHIAVLLRSCRPPPSFPCHSRVLCWKSEVSKYTQPNRIQCACFNIALANRRNNQPCHPPSSTVICCCQSPPLTTVYSSTPSFPYINTPCSGEAVIVKFTLLCIINLYYYSARLLPNTFTGLIPYAYISFTSAF